MQAFLSQARMGLVLASIFCIPAQLLGGSAMGAVDGPGVGGGGGTVLCLNADQSIRSVRLVDLEESAFYDRTTPIPANLPWERIVELAMQRLSFVDPQFYSMLTERVRFVKGQMKTAFIGTEGTDILFPAPQDLSKGRVPPIRIGCQVVGAAVFNDVRSNESRLRISHLLWQNMDELNKAGLFLHEAIYLTHRDIYRNLSRQESPDSSATRQLVGFLLSTEMERGSQTAQEREKFRGAPHYRPYSLDPVKDDPFRTRVAALVKPLLPYVIKGLSPTVFLQEKSCKGAGYTVEVPVRASAGCKPVLKSHLWPNKLETHALKEAGTKGASKLYSFTMHKNENVDEDLLLQCPSAGLRRFNPGFRLYCGSDLVADVPGTSYRHTTGFSLKKKRLYDASFLNDFRF